MSTSALVIRPLSLAEFRERCGDQLQEHWSEVPTARVMGLRPDWDRYAVLDDADQLLILGAFDGAEIIGYASVVLQPHLHDRETPVGLSDMIYVAPAWRKGTGLGMQMVAEVERHARDAGAKLMIWFARGTLDVILRASDYEIADTIYSKEL